MKELGSDHESTSDTSCCSGECHLVSYPHVPPGEKPSIEQSQNLGEYSQNVVRTSEISRLL